MISARELSRLQTETLALLDSLCTIVHREFVSDGAGGQTAAETPEHDVPCRVLPGSASTETVLAGAILGKVYVTIMLPAATHVGRNDLIVVNGRTCEVLVPEVRATRVTTLVRCVELA